jgi:hypothetical protein
MILAFNAWDTILLSGLRLFCVWVCLEVFKQVLSLFIKEIGVIATEELILGASSSSYNLISNKQQPLVV